MQRLFYFNSLNLQLISKDTYEEVCIELAVYNVAQMGKAFFPLDYILTVYCIHFHRRSICSYLYYLYSTFEFQLLAYG